MRSWCEVFVEQELFQSVTQRFRQNVMMARLDKVRVDHLADAIGVVAPMFDKVSGFVSAHSHAFQQSNTKPTIEELMPDWETLTEAKNRYEGKRE